MIRNITTHRGKECHALAQSVLEVCKCDDLALTHGGGQLIQIVQIVRLFNVHRLVGSPGGQYLYIKALVFRDLFVPFQRIDGIIGGADQCHIALADQIAHAHGGLLQFGIAQIPDLVGGSLAQHAGVSEVSLQLQMAPVKQRVADGLAQTLGPFAELFVVGGIAGDIFLLHAAGTHKAPFVVVAAQPHLRDIVELSILGNLSGIDVAVVVQHGSTLCVVVEQLSGSFRLK